MGTGIFQYLLDFDLRLVWVCSEGADTAKLAHHLKRRLNRSLEAGIIGQESYDVRMASLITGDPAALRDCDLIIEAIPEDAGQKQALFNRLDRMVDPECLFASNSSSLRPSMISPAGPRAGRFAGVHFFYPVAMKDIVEVTGSPATLPSTIESIGTLLDSLGRRYIVLDETNSFLLNRIFLDIQTEAWHIVAQGQCTVPAIDRIVGERLFPHGVFDFCDSVGLDTMLASVRNYVQDYPHRSWYAGFMESMATLVANGKLGRKSGEGFYRYPGNGEEAPLPGNADEIATHFHQSYVSASKRFTAQARLPIDDANHAIREYFGLEKGPFER